MFCITKINNNNVFILCILFTVPRRLIVIGLITNWLSESCPCNILYHSFITASFLGLFDDLSI
ncbi:hypothetical protein BDF21DRAFT_431852 [Thamnidium elegans]|nr:hypothetical protein BDF21DRAFT_431852 [Thamnidium elegans]